jgi:nicotine blue oxidoreductase
VKERLVGVVLAAGSGARMGGSKALLLVDGAPLARLHAERLREAACEEVLVVTRPELLETFAADARCVESTAPDPAGSLAVGVRALQVAPTDVVVVTPVDALPARAATIRLLVEMVLAGAEAATPQHGGRGGHPVVVRARVLAPFADALRSPPPLREVLAALGPARVRVETADPGVPLDLDTPEDVARVTGSPPSFARPLGSGWGRPDRRGIS